MRSLRAVIQLVFCAIFAYLLASCTETYNRFVTIEEAYPSPEAYQITAAVPSESYKKVVLNVPYADVFRAVEVAATQVGMNIESSDRSKGLILAIRQQLPRFRRYYAITVKELGSKTTEIVVFSKAQSQCYEQWKSGCKRASTLHWSGTLERGPVDSDSQTLLQVTNFMRNNLIAAGAL